MLGLLARQAAFHIPRNARRLSEVVVASSLASGSTVAHPPHPTSSSSPSKTHSYFVPRNTKGNLPVYTDVRNAGGRYLVLIRNVEGNVSALAKDLSNSLFEQDSDAAARLKIQINQSKHLTITGGRWKNEVLEWLRREGF
ncbi:hypothetical protein M413DRAFT_438461 [Hebeloma cylindrosporum]|uniref:Large ribosomal subunit protein mL49 n=1 Tax=Hebeloma cylindrosporum TaxID=76867 RepID=A0A0C3CKQ9_HEBCY|nr:hypothetical protein M413DRAFT_438461 [Hebeloma cylindrosporum h7]